MKFRFFASQTQEPSSFYQFDPVTIYDGSNDEATQIAELGGNMGSFVISSTGNSLYVKFETNSYTEYNGFHATIHHGNPYMYFK